MRRVFCAESRTSDLLCAICLMVAMILNDARSFVNITGLRLSELALLFKRRDMMRDISVFDER